MEPLALRHVKRGGKGAGHAGSRLGWAVVADSGVAEKMLQYLESTTQFAFESQYRGTLVLEHLLATAGGRALPTHPPLCLWAGLKENPTWGCIARG